MYEDVSIGKNINSRINQTSNYWQPYIYISRLLTEQRVHDGPILLTRLHYYFGWIILCANKLD